jgi:hypothetical protein
MMLSLSTVPTAAAPTRTFGRQPTLFVSVLVAALLTAIVFAVVAVTGSSGCELSERSAAEMSETERLVAAGYLPAAVLEPAC